MPLVWRVYSEWYRVGYGVVLAIIERSADSHGAQGMAMTLGLAASL